MRTLCMLSQIQQQRSFRVRLASTWWMQIQYSLSFLFWSRLDQLMLELLFRYFDELIVVHLSADWCWTQVLWGISKPANVTYWFGLTLANDKNPRTEFYSGLASRSVTLSPLSFLRPLRSFCHLSWCHEEAAEPGFVAHLPAPAENLTQSSQSDSCREIKLTEGCYSKRLVGYRVNLS